MVPDRQTLIELYTTMKTIRRFEERVAAEFFAGTIVGFVHSYIGQEAIATGVCQHLSYEDRIVSHHRGHGHCIAKGADMKKMMAEIYGKKTGYCKGKGGSMHIADFSIGMLGADGIVGAGLPIAAGAAMAAQLEGKGTSRPCSSAMAPVRKASSMRRSTWRPSGNCLCSSSAKTTTMAVNAPATYSLAAKNITRMPEAYHIPAKPFTAMMWKPFIRRLGEAVDRLRKGEGPYFLECETYRWHKHFLSDWLEDARPHEEMEAWADKCPVTSFEARLLRQDGPEPV